MTSEPSQFDKFKKPSRELETDGNPKRLEELLGMLVKHKLVEKPA